MYTLPPGAKLYSIATNFYPSSHTLGASIIRLLKSVVHSCWTNGIIMMSTEFEYEHILGRGTFVLLIFVGFLYNVNNYFTGEKGSFHTTQLSNERKERGIDLISHQQHRLNPLRNTVKTCHRTPSVNVRPLLPPSQTKPSCLLC